MKRGQGVLFLELFNSVFGEIYDSFQLGILGIVMSRRVVSVIAAIRVLKIGSATLLNSLLRLRGGIRARSAA